MASKCPAPQSLTPSNLRFPYFAENIQMNPASHPAPQSLPTLKEYKPISETDTMPQKSTSFFNGTSKALAISKSE